MFVRNRADYRTVCWLTTAIGLVAAQFARPDWALFLSPLSCYFAVASGVIAHNHNHYATFSNKRLNNGFGHLLTLFYGYPTLMWIPTHNLNHHRHLNRPGDATITWRISNKHNFWLASTYFLVSSFYQSPLINKYIGTARRRNRRLYRRIIFQYVVWIGALASLLVLACSLHGLLTGAMVWGLAVALPSCCSLSTVMFFNYTQHVHTDAWSEHDHSRNFTGPIFNYLFFNNGYHTAHHENQNLHWAALPAAHELIAHLIRPELNQANLTWYLARQFLLAPLVPQFGTRQIGQAPAVVPQHPEELPICGVYGPDPASACPAATAA
jgi:beta-carotene hydroxylase